MSPTPKKKKSGGQTVFTWFAVIVLVVALMIKTNLSEPENTDPPYWNTTESGNLYNPDESTDSTPAASSSGTEAGPAGTSTPSENQTPAPPRLPSIPDALQDHLFLNTRGFGHCNTLTGDVLLTVIFVNDPDSTWTEALIQAEKDRQAAAVNAMLSQAGNYGASVTFRFNYLEATVEEGFVKTDYTDWANDVLSTAGLSGLLDSGKLLKDRFGAEQVPVIFMSNKPGRSFAVSFSGNSTGLEHAILYKETDAFSHELLHMFGSKDLYEDLVVETATGYFSESIMISSSCETVDSLTAYLIGWTDTADDNALHFLEDTASITKDQLDALKDPVLNGYGTLSLPGGTYTGEIYEGVAHGEGKMVWDNGSTYEGTFDNGSTTGYGTMTWASGTVYTGDMLKGSQHGEGTATYPDGGIYTGHWEHGKRQGQGTYTYPSGSVYVGQWADSERNGNGFMTYDNGNTYEGNWLNGKPSGEGTYTFQDGGTYVGTFADGMFSGQGTFTYTGGDSYTGQWSNGKRHGQGTYHFINGSVYIGQWVEGNRTGQGTMTYSNGAVYTGSWQNNAQHGEGTMTYANGDTYTGGWANGKRHGQGTYTFANGSKKTGSWDSDTFVG